LKLPIAVAMASLSVTLAVWQALLAGMAHLPSLILVVGFLLSAVLACMTYFATTSREREAQLKEVAWQQIEHMAAREVAQQALRTSEERYRSLIDSASDIIYRADPDGHFTFVNPVASRVMNRTQDELIGMHFLALVEPAWRERVAKFYSEQFHARTRDSYFEFPAVDGTGATVWIGQNVQLLEHDGKVAGFQAVARDITLRKEADEQIAGARDAALASDRLKSEFVANVSHELRTPMNGILGLTDLLLETDLAREQREYAVTVRECGESLLALLNDILDLSKVAAGKLEIQSIPFDLRRLVQQTTDLFAEKGRSKNVEVVCVVRHDVPEAVLGDPGRFRQVLTNLLANAVKFTEAGEITVRVSMEPPGDGEPRLRVEVSDTGIGVTAEAQAQLFQPFVQADGSITRKYGGTGLGLTISRQLAELMGGEMQMSSEIGRGSTFWFSVRATPAAPVAPAPRTVDGALNGVRVLAVDDSDSGRQRLRMLVESWGMDLTESSSPATGLRTLEDANAAGRPFDIAIVDLRNTVGPGGTTSLEFAESLHGRGLTSRTRVILLISNGVKGDALRARDLGVSAYLTKPIMPSDLFDCVATVLRPPSGPNRTIGPEGLVTRYTLDARRERSKGPLLVVEDNIVNQKVMVGLLTKLGYKAQVAGNGVEALSALERGSYPLILMDSQMPEMDGFATTAEIRRREGANRKAVIVAVTAHAMKGERERCLAAGMDDYMSKPISLERLKEVLARWCPAEPDERSIADAPIESASR
jgi:two-component system sensor histidine kinase/response regulator